MMRCDLSIDLLHHHLLPSSLSYLSPLNLSVGVIWCTSMTTSIASSRRAPRMCMTSEMSLNPEYSRTSLVAESLSYALVYLNNWRTHWWHRQPMYDRPLIQNIITKKRRWCSEESWSEASTWTLAITITDTIIIVIVGSQGLLRDPLSAKYMR